MIPLTDAVIDYPLGDELRRERVGTLIVNRSRIEHIIEAVEHDVALRITPSDAADAAVAPDFGTAILASTTRASP